MAEPEIGRTPHRWSLNGTTALVTGGTRGSIVFIGSGSIYAAHKASITHLTKNFGRRNGNVEEIVAKTPLKANGRGGERGVISSGFSLLTSCLLYHWTVYSCRWRTDYQWIST